MGGARIRKIVINVEETHRELDKEIQSPTRKATAAAVIENPCAGRFVEDLEPLMAIGEELGGLLGGRAVAALGVQPDQIQSYGKSAIVGEDGELEHAAAILHPRLGKPLRKAVGKGEAIIPSSAKRGGPGTRIDVPLHHKDNEWDFAHFDTVTASVQDAPRAGEIVVVIAVTDSGRPLFRIGSKTKEEVGAGKK